MQSLPLCIAFAAASGLLRVCATMALAYPDYLEKQRQRQTAAAASSSSEQATTTTADDNGDGSSSKAKFIAVHLFILLIAAILSIVSNIYGPVSISVPIQTGSCLLFNVAAMGIVLKMRAFNKAQRTGTCKFSLVLVFLCPFVFHLTFFLRLACGSRRGFLFHTVTG